MSQFFLQNEEQYCYHPKLAKYFVPLTDAKFQDYLDGRKRSIKLMCRSSEFNQDKTTLIVTNNPLPDLNSSHRKDTPMKFFCKEHLGRGIDARSQLHLPPLKTQQNQLIGPGACFAEGNAGRSLQFRFSTDTDFKTEGQFSKSYAERRLLKLYPHLHFQAFPKLAMQKVVQHIMYRSNVNLFANIKLIRLIPPEDTTSLPDQLLLLQPSNGAAPQIFSFLTYIKLLSKSADGEVLGLVASLGKIKGSAIPSKKEQQAHKRNKLPVGTINSFLPF